MPLDPLTLRAQRARSRARRARLWRHAASSARRRAGPGLQQRTRRVSIAWRHAAASSCGCPGRRRSRFPRRLRAIVNRSTAAQERLRYRNARTFLGAITWLARGCRRRRRRARRAPSRSLCAPSAICRRLPGLAGARPASHLDREPAHRRDRAATSCPTWRSPSSCFDAQLGAGPGHADRRQRAGAHACAASSRLIGVDGVRQLRTPCAHGLARSTASGQGPARGDRSRPPCRPPRAGVAAGRLRRRSRLPH